MPKPKLTDKERNALDEYAANPKISKSEAIRRSYEIGNPKSAGAMAARLFNKPEARRYLEEHADRARNRIIELMEQEKRPDIALKAAQDILDRTDGKPTQKVESKSQKVTIVADFTGGAAGPSPGGQAGERPPSTLPPSTTPEAEPSPSSASD